MADRTRDRASDVWLAGYASIFDVADAGGDVVLPGAFGAVQGPVPLLWQHDAKEPIGFVERIAEDARGLRVVARVVASGRGAQAARLLEAGAIDGLSFGYRSRLRGGTGCAVCGRWSGWN